MKSLSYRLFTAPVAILAATLALGTLTARANLEVSASIHIGATTDFYEPLGSGGTWVEVGSYGRCWHPAHVETSWRPYCDGSWVWTDCGWYWESDEPWSWACYHYGSWVYDSGFGWVWVPSIEWAPAWVTWRVGGGHIGWAPCAPRGVVVAGPSFVFVEERHFHERQRPTTVIVNNTTIINQTTIINGSSRQNRNIDGRKQTVVINKGPDVKRVEKASGQKFQPVAVREADHRTVVPANFGHQANNNNGNNNGNHAPDRNNPPGNSPANNTERPRLPDSQPRPQSVPEPQHVPDRVLDHNLPAELPRPAAPAEKNLPPEKHEVIPQTPPSRPEAPLIPQPGPSERPALAPPVHETVIPQTPPVRQIPATRPFSPSGKNYDRSQGGRGYDRGRNQGQPGH